MRDGELHRDPCEWESINGKKGKPASPWEGMVFIIPVESETQWSGTDKNWPSTPMFHVTLHISHGPSGSVLHVALRGLPWPCY